MRYITIFADPHHQYAYIYHEPLDRETNVEVTALFLNALMFMLRKVNIILSLTLCFSHRTVRSSKNIPEQYLAATFQAII